MSTSKKAADLTVHVGGGFDDAARRFADVWRRAERGEDVIPERHVTFESWEGLARALSGRRLELLRAVRERPEASVAALARRLGRDYKNVHEDVRALADAGLIERDGAGVRADYDTIDARIALTL